jgi:hypothetical protein
LHLASSEEQHINAIAQQVERDEAFYKSQINNIWMMRTMQATTGTDMSSSINAALLKAQQLAINLQRNKEQMQKVKLSHRSLTSRFPSRLFNYLHLAHKPEEGKAQISSTLKKGSQPLTLTRILTHVSKSSCKISMKLPVDSTTQKEIGEPFLTVF